MSSSEDNPFAAPAARPITPPTAALTPEVGLPIKVAHAVLAIVPGVLYLICRFAVSQFGPPIPQEALLFHVSMPWIAFSVSAQHLSHFADLTREDLAFWFVFVSLNVTTLAWFAMTPLIAKRYLFYVLNVTGSLLLALPTAALNMVAVGLFYI